MAMINHASNASMMPERYHPAKQSDHDEFSDEEVDENFFSAYYVNGCISRRHNAPARQPTVSIVIVPGLDRQSTKGKESKQWSAKWKVFTAGTLLNVPELDDNLEPRWIDQTPAVVTSMRHRTTATEFLPGLYEDNVLNILSTHVEVVDTTSQETDIQTTLIEVDEFTFCSLITNFRRLIQVDGTSFNSDGESSVKVLQAAIADIRRLVTSSPNLFCPQTRHRIGRSKRTHYGVVQTSMFRTITTSACITKLISSSAASFDYFTAREGYDDSLAFARPLFLQILVMLISLLNDTDLKQLALFLQDKYRITSDPCNIEIMILKVLPIQSPNKSTIIQQMNFVISRAPNANPSLPKEEVAWYRLMTGLFNFGYILPGYSQRLLQNHTSWLVGVSKPEDITSSSVLSFIQHCDEHAAINTIPPLDVDVTKKSDVVLCMLTDRHNYLVGIDDHASIVAMSPGSYSIRATTSSRESCDLVVIEVCLNAPLNRAIEKTNRLLERARTAQIKLLDIQYHYPKFGIPRPADVTSCGRLTSCEAKLSERQIAVTDELDGKRISKSSVIRHLVSDIHEIRTKLRYVGCRFSVNDFLAETTEIAKCLHDAERTKRDLEFNSYSSCDNPIIKTIDLEATTWKMPVHWAPYDTRLTSDRRMLQFNALRCVIKRFTWIADEILEMYLAEPWTPETVTQFLVTPLRRALREEQQGCIREGREALMVGRYIVIHVRPEVKTSELQLSTPKKDSNSIEYEAIDEKPWTGGGPGDASSDVDDHTGAPDRTKCGEPTDTPVNWVAK